MTVLHQARRPIRGVLNHVFRVITTLAAIVVTSLLLWVIATLTWRGLSSASLSTLMGSASKLGLVQAATGSLLLVAVAFAMAVPAGLVAGVYLAESFQKSPVLIAIRFAADVLSGMPSVVVGVFVCLLMQRMNADVGWIGGSLALAILMSPMIACTTSKTLNEASPALREAALVLGTPSWRILLQISLRAAAPGILSAGLLCVARVAGEVAPLVLTLPHGKSTSLPTLHVEAYRNLLSPEAHAQSFAWSAALVLTLGVLVLVVIARHLGRGRQ